METGRKIIVIVAAHKASEMPSDEMYLPLHVGAEGKTDDNGKPLDLGFQKDNTGDNISRLNPYFCELTGLYWVWKNLDADFIGLVHYRRLFTGKNLDSSDMISSAITYDEIRPMLNTYRAFVPQKRNYYIESLFSHYSHTHGKEHLDACRHIIKDKYPQYIPSYDKVLKRSWGYMFNMMILEKDLLNKYCGWLFDILFELFDKVGLEGMSGFDARYCGRVAEILFNVWIEYMVSSGEIKRSEIKELPYMEDVVWRVKIKSFLMAKFFHKNYSQSAASKKT